MSGRSPRHRVLDATSFDTPRTTREVVDLAIVVPVKTARKHLESLTAEGLVGRIESTPLTYQRVWQRACNGSCRHADH